MSLRFLFPVPLFLVSLFLASAPAALAQASQVAAEVGLLESRVEACKAIGLEVDRLFDTIEPLLGSLDSLGESDRSLLVRDIDMVDARMAGVEGCGDELDTLVERIDRMLGNAAGHSASGNEMLELIDLQERFGAARHEVEQLYGSSRREQRDTRFQRMHRLAANLME